MKVKELIDKLQKLNPEHDVKVVTYNENARCSKSVMSQTQMNQLITEM